MISAGFYACQRYLTPLAVNENAEDTRHSQGTPPRAMWKCRRSAVREPEDPHAIKLEVKLTGSGRWWTPLQTTLPRFSFETIPVA